MSKEIIEEVTKVVEYFSNKICSSENMVSVLFFIVIAIFLVIPSMLLAILYYWIKYPKYMANKTKVAKCSLEKACRLSKEEKEECSLVALKKN